MGKPKSSRKSSSRKSSRKYVGAGKQSRKSRRSRGSRGSRNGAVKMSRSFKPKLPKMQRKPTSRNREREAPIVYATEFKPSTFTLEPAAAAAEEPVYNNPVPPKYPRSMYL